MNLRKAFKVLNGNILLAILISLLLLLFLTSGNSAQRSDDYNLAILPTAFKYVDQYYVDETKIDLNQMIIKGLNKLENLVNEVLVHFPDPQSSSNFTVQVNKKVKSYKDVKTDSWNNIDEVMQDVFSFVIPNLKSTRIKPVEIEYAVIDTMLKTLDQHSGIIPPEVYNEFRIETEGHFGGLGIVIGIRDGQLTVISPLEGTPAYKAGIKSNDKIVQIESESTINMSLMEAVSKLRGKKGTKAKIYIMRDSFNEVKEYSITRDTIKIESVENFHLDGGILYLKIIDFHKNTIKSLEETIHKNRNNINGIILDLRGNPGGLLDQAKKVADIFLSSGTIVITKANNYQRSYHAKLDWAEFEEKVVVLVDSGSASASEIVAGALKNNQRAIIIGEKTFGKGSVQQIFDLKDGAALKLTIASYLTPGNISIQDVGITPDIEVVPVRITEENRNYNDTKEKKQAETTPVHRVKYLDTIPILEQDERPTPDEALTKNEKKEKLNKDFSVQLAKNIIESVNVLNREEVLKKSKHIITDFISKEEKHIELKWKELGIDWSSGNSLSSDPDLQFQIHPLKPKLFAGEKAATTVTVTNNGINPIYRLRTIITSDNPVLNGKELIFGKLLPEQSKSLDIKFDVPEWINTRNDEVKIEFFHSNNEYIKESKFDISTIAKSKPLFAYNFEIVDDGRHGSTGNANGELDEGEQISLVLNIKNIGASKSPKTIVTIKNLSGDDVYLQKGRLELTELKPDENQIAPFLFRVNNKNNINLEISIIDDAFRQVITNRVDIVRSNNTEKFIKSDGWVTMENKTPIMGGNSTLPVIAYAGSGSVFDLLGYKGKYAKIKLPTLERAGWVLKKDIKIGKKTQKEKNNPDFKEVFFYSQPSIDIASTSLVTDKKEIKISGSVADNNKIESISIFKGDDKIKLLTPYKNSQVFSFNSSLEDGINVFSIVAKDTSGLFSKETVTIRKSTSPVTLND